ncbi:MAG: hypothetical protein P9M15_01375 [Candidatus Electryoneaceae bacterium]|nr:hypothetical protein [Candidatus Electryoneaceae bacterium]
MNREDYGSSYQADFLEQYKLYVEMADRISHRRSLANSFFIASNTLLIGIITVFKPSGNVHPILLLALGFFGIFLCFVWLVTINSYRQLNSGKFKIIHKMEESLPFAMYKEEWDRLGSGKDAKKYRQLTRMERYVPLLFLLPYAIMIAYSLATFFRLYSSSPGSIAF